MVVNKTTKTCITVNYIPSPPFPLHTKIRIKKKKKGLKSNHFYKGLSTFFFKLIK